MNVEKKLTNSDRAIFDEILGDVIKSQCFGKSKRQLKLFEYLLLKSLSQKTIEVSQYSIAVDVLDRSDDFDANTDSIVRVELHRLRSNLDLYNAAGNRYTLNVPGGTFRVNYKLKKSVLTKALIGNPLMLLGSMFLAVSTFFLGYAAPGFRTDTPAVKESATCSRALPNVAIGYEDESSDLYSYVEQVLRSTIANQTSFNLIESGLSCFKGETPSFHIDFVVVEREDKFNLVISVTNLETNELLDSYHVFGTIEDAYDGSSLYYKIVKTANAISMPDGILARQALKYKWSSAEARENFQCLQMMYDSFSGGSEKDFEKVHQCLEESVKQNTRVYDNYGALAASYLDLARNGPESNKQAEFQKAVNVLRNPAINWMNSSEFTIAMIYYEIQRDDYNAERLVSFLTDAEARFRTSPQVLLMIASTYGYTLGDWEKAKSTSDNVKKIYSVRDQSTYEIDAGYALMQDVDASSMKDCTRLYSENSVYTNVLVNACARKFRNENWYKITETNLKASSVDDVESRLAVFSTVKHDGEFLRKLKSLNEISFQF